MAHGVFGWWFDAQPMGCLCCVVHFWFKLAKLVVVRGGVLPMGCLADGLRPNPWVVCVVLHTFEAGVAVGPRGAGLMIFVSYTF